jgi:hypothetical protein
MNNVGLANVLIMHAVIMVAIIILITWQHNIIKDLRKKNRELGDTVSSLRLLLNSTFGAYGPDVYKSFNDLPQSEKGKYMVGGPVISDPNKMFILNAEAPEEMNNI